MNNWKIDDINCDVGTFCNGYPIVILMPLTFFGIEFNATDNRDSSPKTSAVLSWLSNFSKISPAYFNWEIFLGAPIISIFFFELKLLLITFSSFFSK